MNTTQRAVYSTSLCPPPHIHVSSSSHKERCAQLPCVLLLIFMYPPPHTKSGVLNFHVDLAQGAIAGLVVSLARGITLPRLTIISFLVDGKLYKLLLRMWY